MTTFRGFDTSGRSNNSNYEDKRKTLEAERDRSVTAANALSAASDAWHRVHGDYNPVLIARLTAQNQRTAAHDDQIIQLIARASNVPTSVVINTYDLSKKLGRPVSYQEYTGRINAHNAAFATRLPPKYTLSPNGVSDANNESESAKRLHRAHAKARIEGAFAPLVGGINGTIEALNDPVDPVEIAEQGPRAVGMFIRGTAQFTGVEVVGEEVVRGAAIAAKAIHGTAGKILPGQIGAAETQAARLDGDVANKMRDLAEGSTDADGNFTPSSVNGFVGFLPWTAGDMVNSFGGGAIPALQKGGLDAAADAVLKEDPAQFANDAMIFDGIIRGGLHVGEFAKRGIAKFRPKASTADRAHGVTDDSEPEFEPEPRQPRRLIKSASKAPYGRPRRMNSWRGKPLAPSAMHRGLVKAADLRDKNGDPKEHVVLFADPIMHGWKVGQSGKPFFFKSGIDAASSLQNRGRFAIRSRGKSQATKLGNVSKGSGGSAVIAVLGETSMLGNPEAMKYVQQEVRYLVDEGIVQAADESKLVKAAARRAKINLRPSSTGLFSLDDVNADDLTFDQRTAFMLRLLGNPRSARSMAFRERIVMPTSRQIMDEINGFPGSERGDAVMAVQLDTTQSEPLDLHGQSSANRLAFRYGQKGVSYGRIPKRIPITVALSDFLDLRGDKSLNSSIWTAMLTNPTAMLTNELIDEYTTRLEGDRESEIRQDTRGRNRRRYGRNRSGILEDYGRGRKTSSTWGTDQQRPSHDESSGQFHNNGAGAAGITKQRTTSQTTPSEAIQTQSDVASAPNNAILTALISQIGDAIVQSGINLFDIYRGAPNLAPQQKQGHVIPPRPLTPVGPTLTTSSIAAHRTKRTG